MGVESEAQYESSANYLSVLYDPQVYNRLFEINTLRYHNYNRIPSKHTQRVIRASQIIGNGEGFNIRELELLKISALLHDIHADELMDHEQKGAELAGQVLKKIGFSDEEIQVVKDNILATRGEFVDGAFKTSPETPMAKALCDADLCILGLPSDEFLKINNELRKELGQEDKAKWYASKIRFLESIEWHTQTARELWDDARLANTEALKSELEKLQTS